MPLSAKPFGVGGSDCEPCPHPAGVNTTPVALRSVLPGTSESPAASVVIVQLVAVPPATGAVVTWTVTWENASGLATKKAKPKARPSGRIVRPDIGIPSVG